MTIKLLGKIISFNPVTNEIMLKLSFISPEIQSYIEDILTDEEQKPFKISFNSNKRLSITYKQQKQFFVDLTKILLAMDIYPDSEHKKAYYEHLKESLFPVKYVNFGDKEIPLPPSSLMDLTIDEANEVIQKNREIHDKLSNIGQIKKIDWDV